MVRHKTKTSFVKNDERLVGKKQSIEHVEKRMKRFKNTRKEKECKNCGKEMLVIPSRTDTQKFCCKNCVAIFQCTITGETHPSFGRQHTKKTKRLMSLKKKGKQLINDGTFKKGHIPWSKGRKIGNGLPKHSYDKNFREKMRNKMLKQLQYQRLNGQLPTPCIGKYEYPILDNLEKCFDYSILRQYRVGGYFLDGYCPALNLAIEVDESHHKYNEQLDKEREFFIKQKLNCQFLRINVGGENSIC